MFLQDCKLNAFCQEPTATITTKGRKYMESEMPFKVEVVVVVERFPFRGQTKIFAEI